MMHPILIRRPIMKPKPDWKQNQINADIAIRNKLFMPGWVLSSTLKSIRNNWDNYYVNCVVNLHYEDEKPVGVVVMRMPVDKSIPECNGFKPEVQIFVKKQYRRKGIGTKLISSLNKKQINWELGIEGSLNFWHKMQTIVLK